MQRAALPAEWLAAETSDLPLRAVARGMTIVQLGTTSLNFQLESGGSNAVVVAPGQLVPYQVVGTLSDDNNQGLALVGFDLDFDGDDLSQADNPTGDPDSGCENPMIHFTEPWGITNPAGFGGTIINGDLIQIGGAQNTINNTQDNAPFPIGSVLLGVAAPSGCGPAVLVTGTLTAPMVPGAYSLALENPFANIIILDTTGVPIWQTQAASIGTISHLAILVSNVTGPIGACCLPGAGGCFTTAGGDCEERGGIYRGDGSVCGSDLDADGLPDACDACPASNMDGSLVIEDCDSGVENQLFPDGCTMLDALVQCTEPPPRHWRSVRCIIGLADQWWTDAFFTDREHDAIVDCLTTRAK
jgi:hypothetical protein